LQRRSPRPRRLTLKAIFDSKTLDEKTLRQPQWMKDNRRLSYLDDWPGTETPTVWVYDSETRERRPLFDPETLRVEGMEKPLPVHSYRWSPDERSLLFTSEPPARFKPCGDLFLYEPESGAFRRLTATDLPQRNAKFSPDGRWIGLVRADNLWLLSLETGEEKQLTDDATETVYNGRFGWVYEEEWGLSDGWAWSPDSARIAYFQQDESDVPEVLLPQYEQPHSEPRRTRYPKAGDPNPRVRVGILTLATGATRWLDLDSSPPFPACEAGESGKGDGGLGDFYITRMQWTPGGSGLLLQRVPRLQNRLDLLFADPETGEARTVLSEKDEAWVDAPGEVKFVPPLAPPSQGGEDGEEEGLFLWPSDRDGFRHLYLYNLSGERLRRLTTGAWEVDAVVGVDAERRQVFFTAALPDATERHLHRVALDGGKPVCLSCERGWHRAQFTEDGARFLHTYSNLNTPPTVTVRDMDGSLLDTLPADAAPALKNYGLGEWELLTFSTSDGETLHARMLKPRDFDPSRRYPVLMCTYGGPGSQVVTNAWGGKGGLWHQLLAQEGYLVFLTDNRGTGGRGRAFKKQTYLKLGEREVHDQIEGAKYLAGLPFVNPKRIGIWGWSYGGYMASLCILRGADVFRAGIAVAPVTDWALYDTIYTERYMRRPEDNPEGYRDSAPVREAEKLKGRFLLIHGTMDDNVHFQNSARLASALQDAKKPFAAMFYPGKHHGIEDRALHLYTLMTEFLKKNL
jgi:dipeptidyl-peptidase-4